MRVGELGPADAAGLGRIVTGLAEGAFYERPLSPTRGPPSVGSEPRSSRDPGRITPVPVDTERRDNSLRRLN